MNRQSEIIAEIREYFEQRADAEYFTERAGPVPNEEMQMLAKLDELQAAQAPASGEVEPFAWVTEDSVEKQRVSGCARRLWWENKHGVGFPIYLHPPAKVPEGIDVAVDMLEDYASALGNGDLDGAGHSTTQAIYEVISLLTTPTPATTPEAEWVRLEDGYPPITGWYCVALDDPDDIGWSTSVSWVAFWNGDHFEECDPIEDGQPVTHWRELPTPPTAQGGEGDE